MTTEPPKRLVLLISGRGSNMEAIEQACRTERWPATIVAVVSSRPDASGVDRARQLGLPVVTLDHRAYSSREAFDAALHDVIEPMRADWLVLAGFMRILTDGFVARHADRLINIHPSLLPAFPGLATHRQALRAGVRIHGATVHQVVNAVDSGRILAQAAVPVLSGDDESHLAARVLRAEHRLYPRVLSWLVTGRLTLGPIGDVESPGEAGGQSGAHGQNGADGQSRADGQSGLGDLGPVNPAGGMTWAGGVPEKSWLWIDEA